ncbi:hypothetical protein QTG54_016215 [Skeletonema marinoi]|uniref:Uncharacterized protein n=1 Tax=Skeletonema marinoi TaxID=267567 RepID=A0AAD9D463_9STRA|nr:hypothetical protein QTG54_016215 [Skeletonema marinoi]
MKNHQGTSKQVTFSEASKLYTYHEDRPQRERLFYNKRDYDAFRENASTAAFHLRRQTEASLDDESSTLYETESWLPSPQILEEADASIEPEEVLIGLEGKTTSERIMRLFDALKRNHRMWILSEQNHPGRLRGMISNVSTVSSYIAHCKAKNIANYSSY